MPVESSAGFLPKAVVAALVGSVAGGSAGVWSLRRPVPSVNAAPVPAVSAASVAPTPPPTRVRTNALPPSADENLDVLQRARTLAGRPDVTALMALREDVVRRAAERGIAGSASVKGELDEIDLHLDEARTLQLKLDAEAFRKADSKPPR